MTLLFDRIFHIGFFLEITFQNYSALRMNEKNSRLIVSKISIRYSIRKYCDTRCIVFIEFSLNNRKVISISKRSKNLMAGIFGRCGQTSSMRSDDSSFRAPADPIVVPSQLKRRFWRCRSEKQTSAGKSGLRSGESRWFAKENSLTFTSLQLALDHASQLFSEFKRATFLMIFLFYTRTKRISYHN